MQCNLASCWNARTRDLPRSHVKSHIGHSPPTAASLRTPSLTPRILFTCMAFALSLVLSFVLHLRACRRDASLSLMRAALSLVVLATVLAVVALALPGTGQAEAVQEERSGLRLRRRRADIGGGTIGHDTHDAPKCGVGPDMYTLQMKLTLAPAPGNATRPAPPPPITIRVNRTWAPLGADHLFCLVQSRFFDNSAIYRVVPGFVAQFGIAGVPALNAEWSAPIVDDPVLVSNSRGRLTYATAGPNTRTTQLFINYADNARLDAMGFAPVGQVVEGMATAVHVDNPTPGDPNGVAQGKYSKQGNAWIQKAYPEITMIASVRVVESSKAK